jgi:hypothetical protein
MFRILSGLFRPLAGAAGGGDEIIRSHADGRAAAYQIRLVFIRTHLNSGVRWMNT